MKDQSSFADYDNDDHKYYANDHHSGGSHNPNYKRKRKGGFLSNLFGFGD